MIDSDQVVWVPFEEIRINHPDPAHIVTLSVLEPYYHIIKRDGYREPLRAYHDEDHWMLDDGFHRWRVMVEYEDIQEANNGLLPILEMHR